MLLLASELGKPAQGVGQPKTRQIQPDKPLGDILQVGLKPSNPLATIPKTDLGFPSTLFASRN